MELGHDCGLMFLLLLYIIKLVLLIFVNLFCSGMPALKDSLNILFAVGPLMPWWHESLKAELNPTFANNTNHLSFYDPFDNEDMPPEEPIDTPSGEDCSRNKESLDGDDVLMRFKLFKQFDAVEDHSDHYYASNVSSLEQVSTFFGCTSHLYCRNDTYY